jgi:xanthine dehydrogenase accessory factor
MPLAEMQSLLRRARDARLSGRWAALAMIAAVEGSAYRRPGAKMLLTGEHQMWGTLSGGCLEADLYLVAEAAVHTGKSLFRRYDLGEDTMWSLGLGCKGTVHVFVCPMLADDPFWDALDRFLAAELATVLAFELSGDIKAAWRSDGRRIGDDLPSALKPVVRAQFGHQRAHLHAAGPDRFLLDRLLPTPKLIVAGAGDDAEPLVRLAGDAGFSVTVLDPRPQFNQEDRFPGSSRLILEPNAAHPSQFPAGAYWVIMHHHRARDTESLRLAFSSRPAWVGVLGPWARTQGLLQEIGVQPEPGRFAAPVGLDLGAETPAEVAVSIVAQLLAIRNGRPALPLHGQPTIHH